MMSAFSKLRNFCGLITLDSVQVLCIIQRMDRVDIINQEISLLHTVFSTVAFMFLKRNVLERSIAHAVQVIMGGMDRVDLNSVEKSQGLILLHILWRFFSEVVFMYLKENVQGELHKTENNERNGLG